MKSIRQLLIGMVIIGSLAASSLTLHAQTAVVGSFNGNLSLVQSPVQDDIVLVTADAAGLNQLDPTSLPRSGTFFVIVPGYRGGITALPYPCMTPALAGLPVYGVTANSFIVDDMNGQIFASPPRAGRLTVNISVGAALELQANATLNLINMLQGAQLQTMSRAMDTGGPMPGGGGGGGSGTNNPLFTIDYASLTNGLWLQVNNYDGNFAYANLNNATDQVYAVWTATDLSTGWQVEAELWPTPAQTNVLPFTVPTLGQPILFVRAEDWTGVTENGNTTPDWWFWEYFGTTALSDGTLDANGNSLLSDFTNNIVPATFTFSGVQVANNYVSATPTAVQLNVTGSPYSMAVLVDDTNFNDAVWNTYTSPNVSVSLWPQGWHDVWIGLRGHADAASAAVWQWKRLKLDYTPPQLFITGPASGTVNMPMIQLTGFSPKALSSISYDLSNAAGTVTNQQVLVLDQSYSTGTSEFTTNTFQAFDVPLTNGVNTITLHATDLAGNGATLVTNFTLDYSSKTNPPTVQITWPQNGTQISGSSFTLDGQLADPTASVAAQIVSTNGATNAVSGLVERTGRFWVENLPLGGGTNVLTLTITDAVGNTSATNISVVQSALTLAMNPVTPDSDLWKPMVNLTGTISDPSQAVWVNGVKGHNNGDGTWSASNVPTTPGGTASFTITAYEPAEQQPDGSYGN